MEADHPLLSREQEHLKSEVADLRVVLRVMLAVVLAGISFFSIGIFFVIPRYEKLFEDMLGDHSRLPEMTNLIIEWGRLGVLPLILLTGLAAAGFVLLATQRSIRAAGFGFVITAVPLLIHLLVCASSLWGALAAVMEGLSRPEF